MGNTTDLKAGCVRPPDMFGGEGPLPIAAVARGDNTTNIPSNMSETMPRSITLSFFLRVQKRL